MIYLLAATADGLRGLPHDGDAALAGHEIRCLVVTPRERWVIVDRRELRRFGEGEWRTVGEVDGAEALCLLPVEGGLLVGTSEPRLLRLGRGGELETVNDFTGVGGRGAWFNPAGATPNVRSLAAAPDGTLFVNVHVGGILRSRDGGRSLEPTIEVEADVHQVIHHADPDRLLAATAYGLATSSNRGDTWSFSDQGLHGAYCRAVAVAGDTLLLSGSTGPHSDEAAVYRRPLAGGDGFVRCAEGLPERFGDNVNTFCLVAAGRRAAIGTAAGEVYVSEDAGETWGRAATGLPRVLALAFGAD